ncbi:thioredoxin [Pseudonocardia hispaniensis]|uniref:Thioredoxin n=1 Tax=Pseudonocardia hispaniensis TaxID=904933 RepID=A0ABW1J6Y3_9PSEU
MPNAGSPRRRSRPNSPAAATAPRRLRPPSPPSADHRYRHDHLRERKVLMGNNTVDVTDASFEADVLKSEKTVLVDFWAAWCGPCRMVAPVLDEIAGEHADSLTIAKLDIDANPATARDYQVMSIPTMIVFKDGKPVKQIVGAKPKAALLSDLADYLG